MTPTAKQVSPSNTTAPAVTMQQILGDVLLPTTLPSSAHQAVATAVSSADLAGRTLEQFLGDLRKLPLFPATAQQAMALAQDDNASLQNLSQLLESDVTLAASVLKLANSPLFNWGQPLGSLNQAVVRLGLRECRHLIMALSMRNLFSDSDATTRGYCTVLWSHCFLTACLCRRLNRLLATDFQGEEFTAGLLHDLGRILFAVTMPQLFPAADPMDFAESQGVVWRETQLFGTDHCRIGSHYADQNGLPESTLTVIRYHHQMEEANEHRKLLGLVCMADHSANSIQRGEEPRAYDVSANPGFVLLSKEWSGEKKDAIANTMPEVMMETVNAATQRANQNKSGASGLQPRPALARPGQPVAEKSLWGNVKSMLGW